MAGKSIELLNIDEQIYSVRGQRVMLDSDLARIYGVDTYRLNEQVKRNIGRFPEDFMFQLTENEYDSLRSQNAILKDSEAILRSQIVILKNLDTTLRSQDATLKVGRGKHRKYLPFVFTEHGAVMLASVLKSDIAVEASIHVVRAFIKLRNILSLHTELSLKIEELEKNTKEQFSVHSKQLELLFRTLKQLIKQENEPRKKIGFIK